MPIQRFLEGAVFDQEVITAISLAFEETLEELELTDRNDPLVAVVARMIIECARKWRPGGGEHAGLRARGHPQPAVERGLIRSCSPVPGIG